MRFIRANVAQSLVSSIKGASINALTIHKVIVIVLKFMKKVKVQNRTSLREATAKSRCANTRKLRVRASVSSEKKSLYRKVG